MSATRSAYRRALAKQAAARTPAARSYWEHVARTLRAALRKERS